MSDADRIKDAKNGFDSFAKEYDADGREDMRAFAARHWHRLASEEEIAVAPDYLRLAKEE